VEEKSGKFGRSFLVRSSRATALVVGAALLLPLSGCGTVGTLVSKNENFEITDSVVLRSRPRDFVAAVEAAAQAQGYKVSGLDRANNKVVLSNNSSMATTVLIGKVKLFRMEVMLGGDGRTVNIAVFAGGNFKTADREKVEKQVADFKAVMVAQAGR
jgi:hypothetical protein